MEQKAWCQRGYHLSKCVSAKRFEKSRFNEGFKELKEMAAHLQSIREVPKVLAEMGVKLVIVEPLPRSKIDGAAFWIHGTVPVILLSLRYNRIDYFWQTLGHELSHVRHKDAISIDSHLSDFRNKSLLSEIEHRADRESAENWILPADLESFIIRIKPLYSKKRIIQFAHRIRIHPGIVTGQLQYRNELNWSQHRDLLAKVQHLIVESALTDGWGQPLPQFS